MVFRLSFSQSPTYTSIQPVVLDQHLVLEPLCFWVVSCCVLPWHKTKAPVSSSRLSPPYTRGWTPVLTPSPCRAHSFLERFTERQLHALSITALYRILGLDCILSNSSLYCRGTHTARCCLLVQGSPLWSPCTKGPDLQVKVTAAAGIRVTA